jgi:hypothetical protein
MVLVESGPAFSEPLSHKIQIKRACIGLCAEYSDRPAKFTEKYNHDICLVSGCCDLKFDSGVDGTPSFTTAILLAKEHGESATSEEITQLDHLTNNLLFAITSDPRRRGLIVPEI